MSKNLEYFEKVIEKWTEKSIEEIRAQYLTDSPIHKFYKTLHDKDAKKGLVRLIDGTVIKVFP